MNVKVLDNHLFTSLEEDLCSIYAQSESKNLEECWRAVNTSFKDAFKNFSECTGDFELAEWHQEVRRLWVFIYVKDFYNPSSIERIFNLMSQYPDWFIELECYSKRLDQNELLGWLIADRGNITINESFLKYGQLELFQLGLMTMFCD